MTDQPAAAPLPTPRCYLLGRLCLVAVLNVVLGLVVSRGLAAAAPSGTTALGWTALGIAWLSTLFSFALLALLLFSLPVLLLPRRWMIALITVGGFGFLQIALSGDTVAFGLFRMHYNQMLWDLLTTPGAGDSVTLGTGTVISIVLVVGGIVLTEALIAWLVLHRRAERFTGRWWLSGLLAFAVTMIVLDKSLYAWADLAGRIEVTRIERYFPLYQRLTMRRLALKWGWKKPEDDSIVVRNGSSGLLYPKVLVPLPDKPNRLNVVVLAIEGCRFDMLDPQVMPRLYAFAQNHTWGRNHFSGGNATRFGISSLLYGVHPTYFQQIVAERQSPFLIHVLKQLGYRISVQSCTDLNFPEFRQTAFVEVPETITDQWPGLPRVERDRAMTDNLVRFIGESGDQPWFAFGFYDASHASYLYPPEHERFLPTSSEHDINFLRIAGNATVANLLPLYNRYRNSLHYIDAQLGRVIDELERGGQLDRTLVFITGDHGEEFGELGFYGHNGSFDRYQTQTAFVTHIPGLAPGPIDRLTSHNDVVPTILGAIGITASPGDYSNGVPLNLPSDRDHVISVSWDSLALIDADSVMVRSMSTQSLANDFLGLDYKPHGGGADALNARRPRLLQLIAEMRAFSR